MKRDTIAKFTFGVLIAGSIIMLFSLLIACLGFFHLGLTGFVISILLVIISSIVTLELEG